MIFQTVGTLIFLAFPQFQDDQVITVDFNRGDPYCAHIDHPKSVKHIISKGKMLKLMGLDQGSTHIGKDIQHLRVKASKKYCANFDRS